ncbi:hypothetical protein P7C70_g9297, partial [Phenoliferia sp. Uapishka_3]
PLPAPTLYVAPISFSTGPPPLPPGSGLKGSKALKAAKKAEKDREKEKERVKLALGGGEGFRLVDLWDPMGFEKEKREERRRRGAELKEGYLTPPPSVDGNEVDSSHSTHKVDSPPTLDVFGFERGPPPIIAHRWISLGEQIESLRIGRERAAKAREEEASRKAEKELNAPTAEPSPPEPTEASPTGKGRNPNRRLPGIPSRSATTTTTTESAKHRREPKTDRSGSGSGSNNVALHPGVEPISDRSSFAGLPASTTTTSTSTVPPLPLSRKPPPLKKGRKKRSAHANANNVHHRDNFVPSRIPGNNTHGTGGERGREEESPLTSWPASDEAVAAANANGGARGGRGREESWFRGSEEWMCLFCEYEVFYGEECLLSKAIRNRKKILKVRQKARERASKAANGPAPPPPTTTDTPAPASSST